MQKKSLKDKLKNNKIIEHIVLASTGVVVIAFILFFIDVIGYFFVWVGMNLWKLPNKTWFIIYLLFLLGLIIAWAGDVLSSYNSKFHIISHIILLIVSCVLAFVIFSFLVLVLVAIGYGIWKFNWLFLLLYIPFAICLMIFLIAESLDS